MTKRRQWRVWSDDEKRMICGQTRVPGASVRELARCYEVNANMVFARLRDARFADVVAAGVKPFLPVEVVGGRSHHQSHHDRLSGFLSGVAVAAAVRFRL